MIRFSAFVLILTVLISCQENEKMVSGFTGNESTYALSSGSNYPVEGIVILREKTDSSTVITVQLSGTEGDVRHPVHLHMGDVSQPDSEVAAMLNPVKGSTGTSETHLVMLADETPLSYRQLIRMNASIKVHLSDSGPDKNVILAAGNIGAAYNELGRGRTDIAVCKSN